MFWRCYSKRSKALKIDLDTLLFYSSCITALLANCVQQGSDSHWKPHTDIPTNPSLLCPAPIPTHCNPSYWNAKGQCQSRVFRTFNPTVRLGTVDSSLCHSLGWQWLPDVSRGNSAFLVYAPGTHSSVTPGVGEMMLMFSVSCFQKSPLLHVWKTTQSSTDSQSYN